MEFYVYDTSGMDEDEVAASIGSGDDSRAVELGLSLGELRQSLVDRFSNEIRNGRFSFVEDALGISLRGSVDDMIEATDEAVYSSEPITGPVRLGSGSILILSLEV